MTATAIAIHAPPLAGRTAVTDELCADAAPNSRFPRLAALSGRPRRFELMAAAGSPDRGSVPVVHTSRVAELDGLPTRYRWLRVLLWVPRGVAWQRAAEAADGEERLREWEQTYLDLAAHPDATWAVALRTDTVEPARVAEIIRAAATEDRQPAMTTAVLHKFLFR